MNGNDEDNILETLCFRTVSPTDIPACAAIEKASYPEDEAASKSTLQYRQHHAAPYFRCAVLGEDDDDDTVIGFVCSTRCLEFTAESMSTHLSNGPLLAVHSVVVEEEYRGRGIATAMLKDYVKQIQDMNDGSMEKIVLMAKKDKLHFYVNCGFQVTRPSPIVHGTDQWYELELDLFQSGKKPGIPCYTVDAFADTEVAGGTGNPAAIVLLPADDVDTEFEGTGQWMQMVAKEFNLSETAFVWPVTGEEPEEEEEPPGKTLHYHIRYYTPTVEMPFCGHATLASSAVLYQTLSVKNKNETTIVLRAREEKLRTAIVGTSNTRWQTKIRMEFPSKPPTSIEVDSQRQAIRTMLEAAFRVAFEDVLYMGATGIGDLLVELSVPDFEQVGYYGIDYDALRSYDGYTRGVILCCQLPEKEVPDDQSDTGRSIQSDAGRTIDFCSRFFAPKAGLNEDPVTGSAHCSLAPYFSVKLNKDRVNGKQTSKRGGIVECIVDKEKNTVKITGRAKTTITGTLWL